MEVRTEYAWYKVVLGGHIPEIAAGEVVGLQLEFGDHFSQFGILEPCTQSGDPVGDSHRIVWQCGVEEAGEIIRLSKDGEITRAMPNGEIDLNPDARSEADLENKPRIIKAGAGKR